MTQTLPVHRLWREGRQEHCRTHPPGGRCPSSPPAASLLSEGGRASAPGRVPSGSFPLPSHSLVQRLHAEGSHMVLCGTHSPGYSIFPGRRRAWLPSQLASPPRCLLPPQPAPESGRLWGPSSPSRGALPSQGERGVF